MEFKDGAQLDTGSVRGSTGSGGRGGKVAVGGGLGVILLVLSLIFGFDLTGLGGSVPNDPGSGQDDFAQCQTADDIETKRQCRFTAYATSINQYWSKALAGYQKAVTRPFTGQVTTACGAADSSVGPFYCPADSQVYLDISFFETMEQQLGAKGGMAAEAYVLAHEYGHHVQNLTGTMDIAQRDRRTGPDSAQVRLELQADCYAGAWLKWAATNPDDPIETITQDDLNRAVDAAISVGDDRIQERSTGRVDRESWTHGSSAMRKRWMAIGWNNGPNSCDTFAADTDLDG